MDVEKEKLIGQVENLIAELDIHIKEVLEIWEKRRDEILKLKDEGWTLEKIGKVFKISKQQVSKIILRPAPGRICGREIAKMK